MSARAQSQRKSSSVDAPLCKIRELTQCKVSSYCASPQPLCSTSCGECIRHNQQNHDDALDKFLLSHRLTEAAKDVQELVEIADDDSWFGSWPREFYLRLVW